MDATQYELDLLAAFYSPWAHNRERAAQHEDYALHILTPEDFQDRRIAAIFDILRKAKDFGSPSEMLALLEHSTYFRLSEEQWLDFILGQRERFVSPEHLPYLAQQVYRASRLRQAKDKLAEIGQTLPEVNLATAHALGGVGKMSGINDQIAGLVENIDPPSYRRSFAENVKRTARARIEGSGTQPIPCGIRALRQVQLKAGHLLVIGAARSAGKSTFGQHFALSAADDGHPSLIVSLEMPAEECEERLLCAVGPCETVELYAEQKSNSLKRRIELASEILSSKPISVEAPSHDAASVYALIQRDVRKRGTRVVVVDFLQQMHEQSQARRSRNDEIGVIVNRLKELAIELQITIVLLSQISRQGVEQPELHHLRDSGTIEQAADEVILVWKVDPELDEMGREAPNQNPPAGVYARVAKHRGGPTSVMWTQIDVDFPTFRIEPMGVAEEIAT